MSRLASLRAATAVLGLAAGLGLAGCPLPQAVPEYPTTGSIAPPRIRSDLATPADTELLVAPTCASAPGFTLAVSLVDENTIELVDARWFVDYAPAGLNAQPQRTQQIEAPKNGLDTIRPIDPWVFLPYDFDPGQTEVDRQAFRTGGGLHVVELVVSNGFALEPADPPNPRPNRTPRPQFETQVYRWVFHYAAAPAGTCGLPGP